VVLLSVGSADSLGTKLVATIRKSPVVHYSLPARSTYVIWRMVFPLWWGYFEARLVYEWDAERVLKAPIN